MAKRSAVHAAVILLLCVAVGGCGQAQQTSPSSLVLVGQTMGTQYRVVPASLPPGIALADLKERIDTELRAVNRKMSTYDPQSELSQFNQHGTDDWFPVSADTAEVIATALELSEKTQGAFDVTVGPLVNLWSFGPEARPESPPDEKTIAAARESVGYRLLEVRLDPPAVRKLRPGVYVDLSAIAKGFGVDRVGYLLQEVGIDGYMVEIGGEVRTRGQKSDGTDWRIGIEKPLDHARAIQRVVCLGNRALATSGDYRNYFEQNGRRYSHTIDPRTGKPIEHALASVSVVADRCMWADAVATAMMVIGPEQALELARTLKVDALLIVRQDGSFVERGTDEFYALCRN